MDLTCLSASSFDVCGGLRFRHGIIVSIVHSPLSGFQVSGMGLIITFGRIDGWETSPFGDCFHKFINLNNLTDINIEAGRYEVIFSLEGLLECQKINQDAEDAFKKTVEVDRLIDTLRSASSKELQKLVLQNVLAFNENFWIRLAARTDTCKSEDDKKDYEELAASVMSIVDHLVHKTKEKIESSTDILKEILKPVVDDVEEIAWPPRDPGALKLMEKEIIHREQEGQLDEGFLAEVSAQLRQAKEDGDKPGLEAMLQKVLQLYASTVLSKRSYAKKGEEVLKAELFLETIIKAPEEEWNKLLINGLTIGKGDVSPDELDGVIKKRIERTLIRTEGGSYQQRVLTEYLKGIQSRSEEITHLLQGKTQ
ncbi:uncharacterized protein E5676_scaffold1428G00980 [Cucumis melo var. makuwa]|uniref:Uncharacterized protein n=1 Tax=Cucumis melo var. makuwa TaxID=1194695 RepID=A0A5D3DFQ0_CUCMM|nr:uncharacterized protein E5676_scaffold1428G00980 [Cucumis melo var. makuwa]